MQRIRRALARAYCRWQYGMRRSVWGRVYAAHTPRFGARLLPLAIRPTDCFWGASMQRIRRALARAYCRWQYGTRVGTLYSSDWSSMEVGEDVLGFFGGIEHVSILDHPRVSLAWISFGEMPLRLAIALSSGVSLRSRLSPISSISFSTTLVEYPSVSPIFLGRFYTAKRLPLRLHRSRWCLVGNPLPHRTLHQG